MRKFIIMAAGVFMLMAFVYADVSSADCGGCDVAATKEGEIINTICPVMGGEVDKDTPFKVEYQGKTIGFCCAGCVSTFNADPEKYMEKLQQKCIIKCPACGAEIDVREECEKVGCPLE